MNKILYLIVLVCLLAGFTLHTSCSKSDKEEILIREAYSQPAGILSVTTSVPLASITATSAIIEGNVISDSNSFIIEKGFEWSTGRSFRKLYEKPSSSGAGRFTLEITGLEPGTTFSVRAYAINSAGIAYGNICGFTTLAKPEITIYKIKVLSQTDAAVNGSVTKIHIIDVVESGICYGTAPAPTTEGLRVVSPNTIGIFTCNLENLIPGTHYYIRAYASRYWDEDGWGDFILISYYGNEITFTAGDPESVPILDLTSDQ